MIRASLSASIKKRGAHLLPKKKKYPALLQDATSNVIAVQPEDTSTPQDQLICRAENQISEKFKVLLEKRKYGEIIQLGKSMNEDDFLEHYCPVATAFEHYETLKDHFEGRKMIPGFLVYGNMALVVKAIDNSHKRLRIGWRINGSHMHDAMLLAFKKDRHDRAFVFLNSLHRNREEGNGELCNLEYPTRGLERFIGTFFEELAPEKDSKSIRRFLTFYGEECRVKIPKTFELFCTRLVFQLKDNVRKANSEKLLVDLAGQPSLLPPTALARGISILVGRIPLYNITGFCWREAVEQGLEEESVGEELWKAIGLVFSNEFPKKYPPSDKTRDAVLEKFKYKSELEEIWAERNAPVLLKKLETLDTLNLSSKVLKVISEYAVSLIDVEDVEKYEERERVEDVEDVEDVEEYEEETEVEDFEDVEEFEKRDKVEDYETEEDDSTCFLA